MTATAWRVLIAGSVVGFLTGFFGVGGGFVIVPALVLALDYEMPVAVGTSLLVIAISSAEGVLFRLSSGGIEWGVAIPFTAGESSGAPRRYDRQPSPGGASHQVVRVASRRCRLLYGGPVDSVDVTGQIGLETREAPASAPKTLERRA
ncbi:sulfite exporter TauE/SafE family protein [Mycobacterium kansasii]|uniref:Probable membrane transporter protein n=1 Tax=Mycobacterium kansasii TaxID=1768 RepID=A0A1V3WTR4_MYCKA|nr:sulfite exporter TauE/SafE family protein [Mycobacterium kansasii]